MQIVKPDCSGTAAIASGPRLDRPALRWQDNRPISCDYGDIYFPTDGAGHSRAVFLAGIGVPGCWRGRARFVIGEAGFGAGLNFLVTCTAFLDMPGTGRLHYLAVENRPFDAADLARVHAGFPEFSKLAGELRRLWPPPLQGIHRLVLAGGRVHLLLALGDAADMLARLEARVDAWYLDGFAPARNPAMWSPALASEIARLSAPGARLASYSVAGSVRRAFSEAGFRVERVPGHGGKRARLVGEMVAPPAAALREAPWFDLPVPRPGPVAIVGGGIAGASLAAACRDLGLEASIVAPEDRDTLPAAAFLPRPDIGPHAPGRMLLQAMFDALRCHGDGEGVWQAARGALVPLATPQALARGETVLARLGLGDSRLRMLEPGEASALLGLDLGVPALMWSEGGTIDGAAALRHLAGPTRRIVGRVAEIRPTAEGWRLVDDHGATLCEAANVAIAAGPASAALSGAGLPGLGAQPGTLDLLPPADRPLRLVGDGGFLSPTIATPRGPLRIRAGTPPAGLDLPAPLARWHGVRAVTRDHLPLAGPLPDFAAFAADYAVAARDGRHHGLPAPALRPGLFVLTALGARGFQHATLMAASVAAAIAGTPQPLERAQREAVHPARIFMRDLIRRRDDRSQ